MLGVAFLVVSQFTLAADTSRGNRPGFSNSAKPDDENQLYEYFIVQLKAAGIPVATRAFEANMQVHLFNDGPTTFWSDTAHP